MSNTLMTFPEWLSEERSRLAAFEQWWQAQQQANPEHFPPRLEPSHYDEAFMTFDPADLESLGVADGQ